jgi:hypothetical protein
VNVKPIVQRVNITNGLMNKTKPIALPNGLIRRASETPRATAAVGRISNAINCQRLPNKRTNQNAAGAGHDGQPSEALASWALGDL